MMVVVVAVALAVVLRRCFSRAGSVAVVFLRLCFVAVILCS